ncbi:MAG TPA: replication-relaxation family protein [Solirubrobacteraceae bacterium]|nr:replication-relaxation family protein [Solirubrobacteraceae bacterium]
MTRRLSQARLAVLADSLSERDRQITEMVVRLRLISGKQLERLFFADVELAASRARLARRTCRRLVEQGVLGRLERRVGGVRAGAASFVYFDAPAAQRLVAYWRGEGLARPRAGYEPGQPFVRHRLGVTECFVRLSEAERDGLLGLVDFQTEPMVPFTGLGGVRSVLRPDAFVRLNLDAATELHAFLEVDCGTESRGALARKASAYVSAWRAGIPGPVFPRVLWITTTDRRAETISETCATLPAEAWKLFAVATADRALEVLTTIPRSAA